MMDHPRSGLGITIAVVVLLAQAPGWHSEASAQQPATAPKLADYFGFQPLEIYKLERRIGNLMVRDLDGDRVGDIVLSNNARSRIELLLSGKRPAEQAESRPFRKEANELEFDRRMRQVSLPVNKEVVSIDSGDFNGDGKPDLVYYGTPAEVEILFHEGPGRYGSGKRVVTGEAVESGNALAVGDLDQDGRDDIALLAENELIFVYQAAPGVLSEPERVPHTATSPRMLKLHDLDGDGHRDLIILDSGADHPIHVRFSTPEKKLGPEQRFQVEPPRAIAFGAMDERAGIEILTIEAQSGRGKVLTLDSSRADDRNRWGRLVFFGLPQGNDRGRALAVGDLDGDRRKDIVVTDPANAQVWLYSQGAGSGLNAGLPFPGLLGARSANLADLDQDGKDELYVLSEQERQIGRSNLDGGRITFPAPLPTTGDPVAMDLGDLDRDKKPELAYVVKGKSTSGGDAYLLRSLQPGGDGKLKPFAWGKQDAVSLPELTSTPTALRIADVNRDGRGDLVFFTGYGSPVLYLGEPEGPPKAFVGSLGPMAAATPPGLSMVDLVEPALVVAQNTFARRIGLDAAGQWEIKDQYNSGRNSAQILGAAALDADGDGKKEVALMDRASKSLLFLALKDGVYRPAGTVSVGALTFEGLHVADFDGDGREDLLIAGSDRFGVLQTGRKGQRLKVIASYESKRNEARLGDLVAGDLNADGVPDVAFTDLAEHMLEIATFTGEEDLIPALSFRLFERKIFRGAGDLAEPRDIACGDVDGDGRDDLVLIVHDRIVVLRQDPGPADKKPVEAAKAAAVSP
ncbi:MAG: VCBS repeat-containing protein [Isosphaeraceae bacterium]